MIVTNQTTNDYWFGPLHLHAGIGQTLTVDDTTATSLYLTNDFVADVLNNLYNSGKISVSGQALPFPRPTGVPQIVNGDGSPDGDMFASQGSLYMRRDSTGAGKAVYSKTTAITLGTGWVDISGDVTQTGTQTLTNKRITKRVTSTNAPGATPTTNSDTTDVAIFTGLAAAITSMTTNLSGTPTEGQTLWFAFTDNGTARALTWGASFEASTVALPTTTVVSTRLDVGFVWNAATSKWRCVAVA